MAEEFSQITVRHAQHSDASAIARIHIMSWRQAYSGYISNDYLDQLDVDERENMWRDVLAMEDTTVFLAENGRVLGFASIGAAKDEDAEPGDLQLYTMYLDPEAWGLGVAKELMHHADSLIPEGHAMTLWVFEKNDRARRFYERHGFTHDGVERIENYGDDYLTSLRYRKTH
ncbi:GNAT family N-acetyltransferase [Jonesia denitrificans]|uniref:GCN5-related N-acetyltransferase n=1 Tax=Jonesia denitrificans (strain ATCC 14870 / DSM 20603 / BCRC 15368 / CIP 55.134 / JCM 11481 / NBRC 15587 / NCTC 10816 / Prevot 55134) TaxID=471856 RepID=C7QYT5_JONDD|nr:GNAT family N-acetyltransferase [Jonesia denitrificans]ACV09324.1 GCN5-related N-acetyltransferase [Jonesia denitrificans DSM 20603]ASE09423.1 N-acetyltransferase [Jonesia denitrificans]QXB43969.1 GNAT family N-acetyltransferase [Jonesia denitrificans]SQH21595.1 Uncharacterized N-acetyltransferase YjaB [Jonesia denitrificans]